MKQIKCIAPASGRIKQLLRYLLRAAALTVPLQTLMAAGPAPVNLGSAAPFAILSQSGITTAGQAYSITGNVGTSPAAGSYETDLVQANISGTIYEVSAGGPAGAVVDPVLLTAAIGDVSTAYNDAEGRVSTPTSPLILNPGSAGNIGGLVLSPGLYKFTSSPASIMGSALTLMGTGGSNDVWIFQCAAGITVNESVILAGGAQAGNIFWQVGTTAVIGTGVAFQGTILAYAAVTMASTSTLTGRALAGTAVTFDGSSLTLPAAINPVVAQGSLQVIITPSEVATNGAQWQVGGGPDQNSGATLTNIPAGNYTVSFTPVSGWITPSNQVVAVGVVNGAVTNITGIYVPSNTPPSGITLLTNGDGTIQHAAWPRDLVIGNKYTVTAAPAAGNLFSYWIGGTNQPYSVLSTSGRYTFVMSSNLLLEANFIANPFITTTGYYNGLFSASNGIAEQTAGMLRQLTVRQNGTYSGTLLIDGHAYALSGRFNNSGQASNQVPRGESQGGPLLVELTLNWNESPSQVTGTVSGTNADGAWAATNLIADLATNHLLEADYTMLLPPDTNNAPPQLSPGGDGYASITNNSTDARIVGVLADGAAFDQTVAVSQDGFVPIYVSLYGGKGLLTGWINLNLTNTNDLASTSLVWIRPPGISKLYANGFTNVLFSNQILISPWTNPPPNLAVLTSISLLDTINATNALLDFPVTVYDNSIFGVVPVSGSINPKTGLFRVVIGSGETRLVGCGAILLNRTNGAGYYLSGTNSQAIELNP